MFAVRYSYASAEALAGDLLRWLDGKPIVARPVSPIERAWRWCRRRPAVASLIAALAATVLMSFVVLFAFYRHADDQRRRAEAAHQRADDQRLRAEMARQEAEQNLEIAAAVIDPLEQLVMSAFQGKRPLEGDQLDRTAKLLREQIARVRTNRTFPPELLARLGNINWAIAGPLLSSGRLDEARVLARERIDLMRQCRERNPENEDYLWGMVNALWGTGQIESAARRFELALDDFDQATALALGTASASPRRPVYASYLFEAYQQLEGRLAPGENSEAMNRARDGQLKVLALFKPEIAAVFQQSQSIWRENDIAAVERGLAQSIEVLHRDLVLHPDDEEVRGIVRDHIARMTREFATRAASQRRDGRLDEADRTVACLMAIAQRLVREFPAHPRAHVMLSEAFLQESKQGWRRNDLRAIKRCLAQSVEEAQRALALDPHDGYARRRLQDDQERLAALPGS